MGSMYLGIVNQGHVRVLWQRVVTTIDAYVFAFPHRMADTVAVAVVGMATNGMAVRKHTSRGPGNLLINAALHEERLFVWHTRHWCFLLQRHACNIRNQRP